MTSVKIKFRPSTVVGKEGVLCYQLIRERKVKIITSRFRLYPHEWDARKRMVILRCGNGSRPSYLASVQLNIRREYETLIRLAELLKGKGEDTLERISECFLSGSRNGYLFPFMEDCIRELKEANRKKTAEGYATTLRSFRTFRQYQDILLEDMDGYMMKKYQEWLVSRDVSYNTVSFYMRILRAVYNKGSDLGLMEPKPIFNKVYTGIPKTEKRAVESSTLAALRELKLKKESLRLSRDVFLFSFYTRGMPFVDLAHLTKANVVNGYIRYKRHKTGQIIMIKVEPCIQEILQKYVRRGSSYLFPLITDTVGYESALRVYNQRLKILSGMIDKTLNLTSYVSRHTWASVAREHGVPIRVISESMGHTSEHTTRIYLDSLGQSHLDDANARLLKEI